MHALRSSTVAGLLPLLCLLLLTACTPAGEKALRKADAHFLAGALDKAEIEYLNALKADPGNPRAVVQLGLIFAAAASTAGPGATLSDANGVAVLLRGSVATTSIPFGTTEAITAANGATSSTNTSPGVRVSKMPRNRS